MLPPDIHTHNLSAAPASAIISAPREWIAAPSTAAFVPTGLYSVGVHPWWTTNAADLPALTAGVEQLAVRPEVIAIGECGLDRLRGGDMATQERIFQFHIALAARFNLPLIIHCVRAFDVLLRLRKTASVAPSAAPWIVHGFRGRPALARQLLDAGMSLSYGRRFCAESRAITPPSRCFSETDEDY